MSFSKVYSAQANLTGANIISIEVDLSRGLHSFAIVGLPDKAVEESRDRISAAIKNSGFTSPKSKNQKVVISLAPADLKKEGPAFDVPMALAYLLACDDIEFNPEKKLFLGELSLDGELRPITGILPLAREAQKQGFEEIFVPAANAREAALISGITVYGANNLGEIIDHVDEKKKRESDNNEEKQRIDDGTEDGEEEPEPYIFKLAPQPPTQPKEESQILEIDFADIQGQETSKRALEIAAAGGHNIAMYGPPGTGKTMLAKAFSCLLPKLSFDEALEVTSIHSVAGILKTDIVTLPPFRAPHHTSSYVSIVGGGSIPKPGEITLAHRGVLFLDEFPEFDRKVIDSLRQPLEERVVTISRAKGTMTFPAHIILMVAMNPCMCGNYGIKGKECKCSAFTLGRYQRRISGPIIDRIDLWTEVSAINHRALTEGKRGIETSKKIRERVIEARKRQRERFKNHPRNITLNSEMSARDVHEYIKLEPEARETLAEAGEKLQLSGRAHHRLMKLAQTIADLQGKEKVTLEAVLEALQYRPKQMK